MSLIGPTGSGKTTLALQLLGRRDFVAVLGTKPRDKTLDQLVKRQGYQRRRKWLEPSNVGSWASRRPWPVPPQPVDVKMTDGSTRRRCHVVLWPEFRAASDKATQRDVFDQALGEIFAAGSWCVFADEVFYLCRELGLEQHLTTMWTQGRSLGLTLVAGTQRPAFVPLYMYDQATHLFLWGDNDETNLRRVGGLGGLSAAAVRAIVAGLPQHSVLYINTRSRQMFVTRVEL